MRTEGDIFPYWLLNSSNGIRTGQRRLIFLTVPLILISAILAFYSIKTLSYLSQQCPNVKGFYHFRPMVSSKVYSDDGRLIHQFFIENRTLISLDEVSPHLKNAIIAVEDSRFYEHSGIDLKGIVRAYLRNIKTGKVAQGGSTITQQIVRAIFLDTETTLSRKIKEALLAWRLERRFPKEEILEKYLNQIYFGCGAWGVESASQTYFGKPASKLNLEESAFLAGIIHSPNAYYPYGDTATKALKRRKHVLFRMAHQGMISPYEALEVSRRPLQFRSRKVGTFAGYFIEYIRRILEERYGTERLYQGGLRIHTTLDIEMQEAAEEALRDGLGDLYRRQRENGVISDADKEPQGAIFALDPSSGHIKAMTGGLDFEKSKFNRAIQARRQPGSSFKAVIYTAAIEKGFTAADVIIDAPFRYVDPVTKKVWVPENYTQEFYGRTRLRDGLAHSRNIVAIKLLRRVGIRNVIGYAKGMGLEGPFNPYLSLALGSSEATLKGITGVFGIIANGGVKVEPFAIKSVFDSKGQCLDEFKPKKKRVVRPSTAYIMTSMLKSVVQYGSAQRAASLGLPLAGKTGTSNDFRDAWFFGFIPRLVAGVWVGFDDGRSLGEKETGARAALPIFMQFFEKAWNGKPIHEMKRPKDIVLVKIDRESGLLATDRCKDVIYEVFRRGTQPTRYCNLHEEELKADQWQSPPQDDSKSSANGEAKGG